MPNVKTAVSIEETLFERAEALARELKVSRSRLFAMALEDFVLRAENRRLLEQLNEAYKDGPDPDELSFLDKARRMNSHW